MTQYCYTTTSQKLATIRCPKTVRIVRECGSGRVYVYTQRQSKRLAAIGSEERV